MKNSSDITLTLMGDDFDAYRITTQTQRGESFVEVYLPGNTPDMTLLAEEVRAMTDKARKCGLAVHIE